MPPMGGGIMQLVAYGAQDFYFKSNGLYEDKVGHRKYKNIEVTDIECNF
jgi:hypothetical protein